MKNLSLIISFIALASIVTFIIVFLWDTVEIKDVPTKRDDAIRVMSYNVKNVSSNNEKSYNRMEMLIDQVALYSPDSIGVQEANSAWMSEDGLKGLLNDYDYIGVGRDDGVNKGEFSAIFYCSSKYNVIDSGTFWLSPTPNQPSRGWDAINRRICTWVTLENVKTGESYTHYNTHMDYLGIIAKIKGINMLLEHIEQCQTPVVLTGDFNFFQDTGYYRQIVKSNILDDSKFLTDDSMSHGTVNLYLPFSLASLKPVDFCFVSPDSIEVITYRVDSEYRNKGQVVSDHFPIIVDFRFKK